MQMNYNAAYLNRLYAEQLLYDLDLAGKTSPGTASVSVQRTAAITQKRHLPISVILPDVSMYIFIILTFIHPRPNPGADFLPGGTQAARSMGRHKW